MPPHAPVPVGVAAILPAVKKVSTTRFPTVNRPGESTHYPEFSWVETDEPHATRRKIILAKHPEIKALFGTDIATFYLTIALFSIQMAMMYMVSTAPWWIVILAAYVVSGTINGTQNLIMHDLSHNLCFSSNWANQALAICANLSTGVPSAITFKRYHLEHHTYQGTDTIDMDLPSDMEVRVFSRNVFTKIIWMLLQPAFYALRPCLVKPLPPKPLEILNTVVQLSFDFTILMVFGVKPLFYLVIGTILGMGLHPSAGHFVAEHYELVKGTETYSYYGLYNYLQVNVGYHNEHHDFPKVPWTRLPQVKAMAPEFYVDLPHHTSYLQVIWRYITDPSIGPASRIKRLPRTHARD